MFSIQQESLIEGRLESASRFDSWERPDIPFDEKKLDDVCDYAARDSIAKVFDGFRKPFVDELIELKNDLVGDLISKGHNELAETINRTQLSYDNITDMLLSYVGGNNE